MDPSIWEVPGRLQSGAGGGSSCVSGVPEPLQQLGGVGAKGLTLPASSNGTDGSRSLSISESWQTN